MISNFDSGNQNRRELRPIRHWRLALAMLVFVSSTGGAPGHAADDVAVVSDTASLAKDVESEDNKQCTWACLKWTNLYNVDPRGVYKGRRSCANFGEICE